MNPVPSETRAKAKSIPAPLASPQLIVPLVVRDVDAVHRGAGGAHGRLRGPALLGRRRLAPQTTGEHPTEEQNRDQSGAHGRVALPGPCRPLGTGKRRGSRGLGRAGPGDGGSRRITATPGSVAQGTLREAGSPAGAAAREGRLAEGALVGGGARYTERTGSSATIITGGWPGRVVTRSQPSAGRQSAARRQTRFMGGFDHRRAPRLGPLRGPLRRSAASGGPSRRRRGARRART